MKPYVREEQDTDIADIHGLVSAAFGRDHEAGLVDRLRNANALKVSLVLVSDRRLIAHASASPMSWISRTDKVIVWVLAPVSVQPKMQSRGFGTQIVRATIDRCRDAGAEILTVLGSPKYYSRFGFTPASQNTLGIDDAEFGDVFMAMELADTVLRRAHGRLRWHPEFDSLGEA